MKTIGVDLHKDSLTVAVLGESGELEQRQKMATKCRIQIQEFFGSYGPQCQVAVESVGFYAWFWDLVQPRVGRLVLANAPAVKALRPYGKPKTDPEDAAFLARLLFEHRLPVAFSPPPLMRQLRTLVRLRCHVGRSLAEVRQLLRWLSIQLNLPGPRVLRSDAARKWILANEAKFSPAQRLYARRNLEQILLLENQEADLDRELQSFLAADPRLARQAALLRTLPGVGMLVAATILGETAGTERFRDGPSISAFAGLVPWVKDSGDRTHRGPITKAGSPRLRWVLQQAAWVAYRSDPNARRIILRIGRHAGLPKAVTAFARKLLVYARSVIARDRPFAWPQPAAVQPDRPQEQKEGAWCYEI